MYSKKSVQGENYYRDGSDTEKFRYNPYRKHNREVAEHAFANNLDLPYPLHLIIEPTNRCNLKCSFCNREVMTRKITDLPFDLYKKAVDQFAEGLGHSISLYALGEPMLHKQIIEMIDYAKCMRIPYVDLSTNMTKDCSKLKETGLDELIISLDGFKKEYESMRKGAKYESVLENIHRFLLDKPKDMIARIQIIRNKTTEPILHEFIEGWLYDADVVYVKEVEAMAQNLGAVNISQAELKTRLKNRQPCKQLWFSFTLDSEGYWSYCCHSPKGDSRIGNIKDMPLKEAWDKVKTIRKEHKEGKYTELCSKCVDYFW